MKARSSGHARSASSDSVLSGWPAGPSIEASGAVGGVELLPPTPHGPSPGLRGAEKLSAEPASDSGRRQGQGRPDTPEGARHDSGARAPCARLSSLHVAQALTTSPADHGAGIQDVCRAIIPIQAAAPSSPVCRGSRKRRSPTSRSTRACGATSSRMQLESRESVSPVVASGRLGGAHWAGSSRSTFFNVRDLPPFQRRGDQEAHIDASYPDDEPTDCARYESMDCSCSKSSARGLTLHAPRMDCSVHRLPFEWVGRHARR